MQVTSTDTIDRLIAEILALSWGDRFRLLRRLGAKFWAKPQSSPPIALDLNPMAGDGDLPVAGLDHRQRLLAYAGAIRSSDRRGADNGEIDEDLATAYGNDFDP